MRVERKNNNKNKIKNCQARLVSPAWPSPGASDAGAGLARRPTGADINPLFPPQPTHSHTFLYLLVLSLSLCTSPFTRYRAFLTNALSRTSRRYSNIVSSSQVEIEIGGVMLPSQRRPYTRDAISQHDTAPCTRHATHDASPPTGPPSPAPRDILSSQRRRLCGSPNGAGPPGLGPSTTSFKTMAGRSASLT